jgi:hypothetical protein
MKRRRCRKAESGKLKADIKRGRRKAESGK